MLTVRIFYVCRQCGKECPSEHYKALQKQKAPWVDLMLPACDGVRQGKQCESIDFHMYAKFVEVKE